MNRDQRKFLDNELSTAYSNARRKLWDQHEKMFAVEPAKVTAARKVIADYNGMRDAKKKAATDKLVRAKAKVDQMILFNDEKAALDALEEFRSVWGG